LVVQNVKKNFKIDPFRGHAEDEDMGPWETAVREAHEESCGVLDFSGVAAPTGLAASRNDKGEWTFFVRLMNDAATFSALFAAFDTNFNLAREEKFEETLGMALLDVNDKSIGDIRVAEQMMNLLSKVQSMDVGKLPVVTLTPSQKPGTFTAVQTN